MRRTKEIWTRSRTAYRALLVSVALATFAGACASDEGKTPAELASELAGKLRPVADEPFVIEYTVTNRAAASSSPLEETTERALETAPEPEVDPAFGTPDAELRRIERVWFESTTEWSLVIAESNDPSYPEGYSEKRSGNLYTTTYPDVVDLTEYFTEEEIDDFTRRLGAKAPDVVQEMIESGVLVPGDDSDTRRLDAEDADLVPNMLLGYMGNVDRIDTASVTGEGDAEAYVVESPSGDRYFFARRTGKPIKAELVGDGSVVGTLEVRDIEPVG